MATSDGKNGIFVLIKASAVVALIVWGAVAWWQLREARRAGEALESAVAERWPEGAPPAPGTRARLLGAAGELGEGDFRSVVAALAPIETPTPAGQEAARRFFAKAEGLRERFAAAAAAAEELGEEEATGAVRDELARALLAAARRDSDAVERHLDLAEATLEEAQWGGGPATDGSPAAAVAALVRAIEPAFLLGRELLLEGHPAVERLLARAAGHVRQREYHEAAWLVRLAGELAGVNALTMHGVDDAGDAELPDWFTGLEEPVLEEVSPEVARAAVELCRAAAASLTPSEPVEALVARAGRELAAGRHAEAHWFAGVALATLGIESGSAQATQ